MKGYHSKIRPGKVQKPVLEMPHFQGWSGLNPTFYFHPLVLMVPAEFPAPVTSLIQNLIDLSVLIMHANFLQVHRC